jgi:hypothetical protein
MKFIINIQKRYIQSPVKHPNQLMLKESGNFEKLLLATFKVLCTNINTMAYGRKTGGRGKGTPITTTRTVREQLTQAFDLMQQNKTANLLSWAKINPTEFYKLAAKRKKIIQES